MKSERATLSFWSMAVGLTVVLLAGCGEDEGTAVDVPEQCRLAGACAVFGADAPLRIGFGGPMSGDYEMLGSDMVRGIEIALAQAADLSGHSFSVVAQDDSGTPEGGTAAASALAADPSVVGVVGHAFSGSCETAMVVYETANIPMVSPSATRISLTQQDSTVFNRVVASDLFQADVVAQFVYDDLGDHDLAIIHDGSSYGQALAERVESVFEDLGGTVVVMVTLTPGGDDYSSELAEVAAESPEALFFGGYTTEAIVLLGQLEAAGLDTIPFVSDDGILEADLILGAGDDAEGVCATGPSTPPDSAAKTAFDAAYLEAYGVAAGSVSPYCWLSYDAANIILAAIRDTAISSGSSVFVPREALVNRVRASSGFEGITGEITCDATGECMQGGFAVFEVDGGVWVEVD